MQTAKKILLTRPETAEVLSLSQRTVAAIPENLLPRCRVGRAIRHRLVDIESLAEKLARGEAVIGSVNA